MQGRTIADNRKVYSIRYGTYTVGDMGQEEYLAFRGVGKIAKSEYYLHHVCPYGTTRFPLDRFS